MILIDAERVSAARPDRPLFTDLSVTISTDDRLGVVGLNGCGKSTLLRQIAGTTEPESGLIRRGRGVQIAVLDQHPKLPTGAVRAAVPGWEGAAVLDRLGMGALLDAEIATLSGGQAKRVALARALVGAGSDNSTVRDGSGAEADLLILDEPTNHLDLDAIQWLEERLARYRGGLILVTHDRHVLDRVCTKVLEIDQGNGYVHEGGYQGYLAGRSEREERAAASESTRQNLARRELAWLRRGAPARTRKPKAHIDAAIALIEGKPQKSARAGGLQLAAATGRIGEGQGPSAGAQGSYRNAYDARLAPRLGSKVVELHGVGHRFDPTAEPLFDKLDWILDPGERYGIVGANGSGKSTLLDIVSGRLVPESGRVEIGPTVRIGYYDQFARTLDVSARVRDVVAGGAGVAGNPDDLKLMEQFWFDADAQRAQVGTLSGGERRRLQLLLTLAERPNVLLLDEPTNDLDLDTLRALEDFLESWPGTLVVVSHDRAFLDRTVEEVLAIEDGTARLVAGGYAGWRDARSARRGASSDGGRGTATLPGPGTGTGTGSAARADPAVDGASSSPPAATPEGERRSASTLRHLIKETDRDIARFTKERDKLATELTAAGEQSDHQALARVGGRLAEVEALLAVTEERWLDLAEEASA